MKKWTLTHPDAELLRAHVLGVSREYLHTHPEYRGTLLQRCRFKHLLKKRAAGTPFAYLTGQKEFYGLNFFVNKYTLVPRPESELLVELALQESTDTIIDVGTGSGCIAIAIKKNTDAAVYATDISRNALRIAEKNAKQHTAAVAFFHGNLLEPILNQSIDGPLIITANLPYLNDEEMQEPSIQAEPRLALYGGTDGLDLYRQLLAQIAPLGRTVTCFMEINPQQASTLTKEIQKRFPSASISIHKDLAGRDRVVHATIPGV